MSIQPLSRSCVSCQVRFALLSIGRSFTRRDSSALCVCLVISTGVGQVTARRIIEIRGTLGGRISSLEQLGFHLSSGLFYKIGHLLEF